MAFIDSAERFNQRTGSRFINDLALIFSITRQTWVSTVDVVQKILVTKNIPC